ncbi:MAG TPA: T9SS type A sorting domain-containing protein [Chitinophagaceae bacterium]|nr:T9SS type A sorting domain-containing protein [Chitinophagales bacterium]HPG11572.1 T9SS type A sorting domain-containing protein [Chitinophagaceae bacterium]
MKQIVMMKNLFTLLFLSAFYLLNAQSSNTTLDVVSWNLEFFGAPYASGPADKDLQEANAKKIMRYIDADIYGLQEIVDSSHLRKLRDSLGINYEFIIAPYSTDGVIGSNGWRQSQKLAVLYKKDVFSNISTRGMMLNSPTAVSNWANGRLPFLFKADATVNGITKTIHFIVIHAKSGSTTSDYSRRLAGAQELKDTLDANFSNETVFIIGDFNDALNHTIVSGSGPQSSFQPIVADSTDADHYRSITITLANLGQTSMINFPNVIDNHVISNEVSAYYIPGSVQVRTDVTSIVPDYVSAHNTSDHYPVFSNYNLSGVPTGLPNITPGDFGIKVSPNPFNDRIYITASKTLRNTHFSLFDTQGRKLITKDIATLIQGSSFEINIPASANGTYFLQAESEEYKTLVKLIAQ